MDAEYFSTRRLTRKSDVYAFGVVLLEVLCGRPALDFTLDEQQHSLSVWARQCIQEGKIDQIIDPSVRGEAESNCLKEFGQIAYECILNSSKDRPTMTKVLARLEFVLSWTSQSVQSATNWKYAGKSMFIGKSWSMFLTKGRMSPNIKKLGQNISNKKKSFMMAKGGGAQQVVPPRGRQIMIPKLKMFTFSELKTATKNFCQESFLGEGGYGKVFKGWLDSVTLAPQKTGDGIAVAIKKSSPNRCQGLNEWQAEVKFLGTFSHPNVIKLFGYCWEDKNFLLVYEYMQGDLDTHLFRGTYSNLRQLIQKIDLETLYLKLDFAEGTEPLSWDTRVKIAMGAAQGLAFLHTTENNVICRDVKSSNILLDKASISKSNLLQIYDFNVKLADFGLAKLGPLNGESHVSTGIAGTYGYMAPEYVATG
ncbi:putative transferase, protein kinase RLK-Pelle-DLSV family [Helianthus annuus]|nr:putative transferase, protein kinase RLK-Pelle-DLSV family [Helianthus annuus]